MQNKTRSDTRQLLQCVQGCDIVAIISTAAAIDRSKCRKEETLTEARRLISVAGFGDADDLIALEVAAEGCGNTARIWAPLPGRQTIGGKRLDAEIASLLSDNSQWTDTPEHKAQFSTHLLRGAEILWYCWDKEQWRTFPGDAHWMARALANLAFWAAKEERHSDSNMLCRATLIFEWIAGYEAAIRSPDTMKTEEDELLPHLMVIEDVRIPKWNGWGSWVFDYTQPNVDYPWTYKIPDLPSGSIKDRWEKIVAESETYRDGVEKSHIYRLKAEVESGKIDADEAYREFRNIRRMY